MAQNLQKRPFPFSFFHCHLFSPFFCCVTDDFNYLLTPCTQQIHMINCPGGRYSHHLDGAKESKELFYAVILKTATTAGGGIAGVPRENKKLAQFRFGWQLFSVVRVTSIFPSQDYRKWQYASRKGSWYRHSRKRDCFRRLARKLQDFLLRLKCRRWKKKCEVSVDSNEALCIHRQGLCNVQHHLKHKYSNIWRNAARKKLLGEMDRNPTPNQGNYSEKLFFTLNATTAYVIQETTTTLSCWGIVPSAKVGVFSNNSALKRL